MAKNRKSIEPVQLDLDTALKEIKPVKYKEGWNGNAFVVEGKPFVIVMADKKDSAGIYQVKNCIAREVE